MSLGFGSRNCWMWKAAIAPSQSADHDADDDERRASTRAAGRRALPAGRTGRARRPCSSQLLHQPALLLGQRDARRELRSARARRSRARRSAGPRASRPSAGCGRSISTTPAMRPGRAAHHDDARSRGRPPPEIECVTKTTVERELLPDREQLEVEPLARHLVERAERLVHQQEGGLERERARDRDALLHAAGELPRVVVARSRSSSTRSSISATRPVAARRDPSRAARAGARCSSRPCASRRGRRPGRRSRSRRRCRAWRAGLAVAR